MSTENKEILDQLADATQMVHVSLPLRLLSKIDDYVENDDYGKANNSRSSAIRELLTVGLWFASRRKEFEAIFKNPELMEELQSQLSEGGLVDYVQRMKWQEFQVVWSIFKTEAKSRKMS
jgi:Arc/MetJ-type ribon-helix-helix transcriptional regulator